MKITWILSGLAIILSLCALFGLLPFNPAIAVAVILIAVAEFASKT